MSSCLRIGNLRPPSAFTLVELFAVIAIIGMALQASTSRSLANVVSPQTREHQPFSMYAGYTQTRGGDGGKIIRVTNLNASGPGSLRAALTQKEPRIVVFAVGGVINLKGLNLVIREPFLTIAGQTAPSPGITLIDGALTIKNTHDVIIRHLRFRPGDGNGKTSKKERDGITTNGASDVIIDHCSFSWATDENLSASGARNAEGASCRITFSNNIIAEALNNSLHPKGSHSMGSLIHDFTREFSIIGNFYAHNRQRNPLVKAAADGVIVNNLIYNPGDAAVQLARVDSQFSHPPENCRVAIVGNILRHGNDTVDDLPLVLVRMHHQGSAYLEDNVTYRRDGSVGKSWWGNLTLLDKRPTWPDGLNPIPSSKVESRIILNAGARPNDRDEVDLRIIRDFQQRKGHIIDSQDEVGGYPSMNPVWRELDVPASDITGWLEMKASELESK